MSKPRVVFMGTPAFAVPTLTALAAATEIVGVYTQPDRPAGRGLSLNPSPVKAVASAHGLPVFQPERLRSADAAATLAALRPDVVVVAAYGLILPMPILQVPEHGCLNVHASLLPRWRGASPISAAILAGDADTGCTIMRMEKGLDTGPILSQRRTPILPEDTAGTLHDRLAPLGASLLVETLGPWLAGQLMPQPQDEAQATYAPMVQKEQGRLDWNRPAEELARQVRAYNPWPSAFFFWNDVQVKVWQAEAVAALDTIPPGRAIAWRGGAAVGTGRGALRLLVVQMAGRKRVPMADFLRGAPHFIGAQLDAQQAMR